jgi:alpha-ketoglutarate-dependent taurine dioxygenase
MIGMCDWFDKYYVDISAPDFANILIDRLKNDGIVTYDQLGSKQELIDLARLIGAIRMHVDADKCGVTHLAPLRKMGRERSYLGFTSEELYPHTDGTSVEKPASIVMLHCIRSADEGGASVFVDGKTIYRNLAKNAPDVLETFLAPRSVIFGGSDCPFIGSIFTELPNGNLYVRFRFDHLGYFSSPLITKMPILLNLIDASLITLELKRYQGYIVQNGRWLHGRTSFHGDREMLRILLDIDSSAPAYKEVKFGFSP